MHTWIFPRSKMLLYILALISVAHGQNCVGTNSASCTRTRGCGWCGLSKTNGKCVPANADNSGPAIGVCRTYWDNSSNCMDNTVASSCERIPSCGWCGVSYKNGTCVLANPARSGPNSPGGKCISGLWDFSGCMTQTASSDSASCVKNTGCGWCGKSYNEGLCIMKDSTTGNPSQNLTCPYFWEIRDCLSGGRYSSDYCTKRTGCGWCGTAHDKGKCVSVNSSGTGPISSVCTDYWDTKNCMYQGSSSSNTCNNLRAGCGWCGKSYSSGVCLPKIGNNSEPLGGYCDYFWDNQNCMYGGQADSDDCAKRNCGWCGTTYNKGVCIPRNFSTDEPAGNNVCNATWDTSGCTYKGRNGQSNCISGGCKWCDTEKVCLKQCPCPKKDYTACLQSTQNGCGWCTFNSIKNRTAPSPVNGMCTFGSEYVPSNSGSCSAEASCNPYGELCDVWDGSGCTGIVDSTKCEQLYPCKWCKYGNGKQFCVAEVPVNNGTLYWCIN